jgi:hypothetical protein
MPVCFVIQPFDRGKFDKRFRDIYRPAIEAAGLEAYRVDEDHSVDVPIDAIEQGIRTAAVCLADITTDNPNVWYELGFAFASGRPVVMVCSSERAGNKYPFDIQHRTVIPYGTDSPSDFDALKRTLTDRIRALVSKGGAIQIQQIEEAEQVSAIEGLSQPELFVLAEVARLLFVPTGGVGVGVVRNALGTLLTDVAITLGLRRLMTKGFVELREDDDGSNGVFCALYLTERGWQWIEAHEDRLIMRRSDRVGGGSATKGSMKATDPSDDEIPF